MALPTEPTTRFASCVVAAVRADCGPRVSDILERIRIQTISMMKARPAPPPRPLDFPFERIPGLHFARFVVVPPSDGVGEPRLVFASDFDAPDGARSAKVARARHYRDVIAVGRAALDELFACCEAYPRAGAAEKDLIAFLERHHVEPAACHEGSRGRRLDQIHDEHELRLRIEAHVDSREREYAKAEKESVRRAVRDAVGAPPPFPPQRVLWLRIAAVALALLLPIVGVFVVFGMLGLWWVPAAAVVVFVVGALVYLRFLETRVDPTFVALETKEEHDHERELLRDEDLFFQNQLTHVVAVKPGLFRRVLLRLVFAAIDFLARTYFVRGKLGEIPSIHFARWMVIDEGRRVLFLTNFDNSWESYLGDFIDKAANGLTGVWSNTELYPRTFLLLWGGATNGTQFKAWARHFQIPTQVWYSAYPQLSIADVTRNTEIRRGLADDAVEPATAWLVRLG